jgi:signal transduction histidine kinase
MVPPVPQLERIEALAFRRQQIAFCLLTLSVLAALLILHAQFKGLLGAPSSAVVALLALSFLIKGAEGIWLVRQHNGLGLKNARLATSLSILYLFGLTWALAVLTDRDDAPYFVLLAIPILQCAYHLGLIETIVTIAGAITMLFAWAHHFFVLHPPPRPTEFLEAGMTSVIYGLMGLIVWYLVHELGEKQATLVRKMVELDAAHERLSRNDKLAAIGRLASGIAHEIRNPVAMIVSSLATAEAAPSSAEDREEMFAIAAREAKRLENLTTDFLAYARPSRPQPMPVHTREILEHVASITRIRASESGIAVRSGPFEDFVVDIDPFQVESALVNVLINAVAATPPGGSIAIHSKLDDGSFLIEVENSGKRIPEDTASRIFEPFFTTKRDGTGLGLAIARAIARGHGGDLWITRNDEGAVGFTMSVSTKSVLSADEDGAYGQDTDR